MKMVSKHVKKASVECLVVTSCGGGASPHSMLRTPRTVIGDYRQLSVFRNSLGVSVISFFL